jgi:hypothetical protein
VGSTEALQGLEAPGDRGAALDAAVEQNTATAGDTSSNSQSEPRRPRQRTGRWGSRMAARGSCFGEVLQLTKYLPVILLPWPAEHGHGPATGAAAEDGRAACEDDTAVEAGRWEFE